MADSQPPATAAPVAAATDLESKEIWGDEADQLDEEVMKVECVKCDIVADLRAIISLLLQSEAHRQRWSGGGFYTDCTVSKAKPFCRGSAVEPKMKLR